MEYHINLGVVNYTIALDKNNKIKKLQVGNETPYYRDMVCMGKITDHIKELKDAFLHLLVTEPEKFRKMYALLKEYDPEMFQYASTMINELAVRCLELI